MSNEKMSFIGIDVSAKELVVEMKSNNDSNLRTATFDNDIAGHRKLLKFITKGGKKAKVCMEATGIYYVELAVMLSRSKKASVMVVNPKAMKNFGTALLQRAKTDNVDAHTILEYLLRMNFIEWTCPSDLHLEIIRLSRRLHQLKKDKTREDNRLHSASFAGKSNQTVKKSIEKHRDYLKKMIDDLQNKLTELIGSDEVLSKKYNLLISVKGLSSVSVSQILSELLLLPETMSASQWVAYAGLDPKAVESGSSINKPRRISRQGNKFLRAALFMPALVAVRYDKNVLAYYEKLLAAGKKKMQAIVAVMRKLLQSIWGMLHTQTQWDAQKFFAI